MPDPVDEGSGSTLTGGEHPAGISGLKTAFLGPPQPPGLLGRIKPSIPGIGEARTARRESGLRKLHRCPPRRKRTAAPDYAAAPGCEQANPEALRSRQHSRSLRGGCWPAGPTGRDGFRSLTQNSRELLAQRLATVHHTDHQVGAHWRNDMKLVAANAKVDGEFSVFIRRSEDLPENSCIGLMYERRGCHQPIVDMAVSESAGRATESRRTGRPQPTRYGSVWPLNGNIEGENDGERLLLPLSTDSNSAQLLAWDEGLSITSVCRAISGRRVPCGDHVAANRLEPMTSSQLSDLVDYVESDPRRDEFRLFGKKQKP